MAKMLPKRPKANTKSEAEIALFDTFAEYLSDEYTIFHSCAIQVPRAKGGVDDYEIDFVIAHPKRGVLLLEVKGGLIQVDSTTGLWSRLDRGEWIEADNPIDQVKEASYQLFEYLKNREATNSFNYATWYAVALPNVDVDHDINPGIPKEIVLGKKELHPSRIEATIGRLFHYYDRQNEKEPPGSRGIKALGSVIAPNWFLNSHLGTEFEYEADQIKELTESQYNLLDTIDFKNRHLIAGCAGSGKTMLAIELARRFAQKGLKVLFTCFNKALAEHLEELHPNNGFLVKHFHGLAYHVVVELSGNKYKWTQAFQRNQDHEDANLWRHKLPELMLEATDSMNPDDKFDVIIVDEGQDFLETYWLPLQLLSRDADDSILYIFYDDAQRIYSTDEFPIPGGPSYYLRKNLRSTKPIGEFILPYYPGQIPFEPAGIESAQDVMTVNLSNYTDLPTALNDVLKMLEDEKVSLKDVCVLTMASEDRSIWEHKQILDDGYDLRWKNDIKGKRVQVSTIQSFKGLERPVVILTELDKASREDEIKMLTYIGMSRARNLLIIIGEIPDVI